MLVSEERRKCEPYWHHEEEGFSAECTSTTRTGSFICRQMKLNMKAQCKFVVHWQYLNWSDHGAPQDPDEILRFIQNNLSLPLNSSQPPIIHCGAGVGRTGTLATLWVALLKAKSNKDNDIVTFLADVIGHFKHQRNRVWCVETPEQYDFILGALK